MSLIDKRQPEAHTPTSANAFRCDFMDDTDPINIEFISLHRALQEIVYIGEPYSDLKFPIGQQVAFIHKQLEHRLRAAHINRPNHCCKSTLNVYIQPSPSQSTNADGLNQLAECCPFRKGLSSKGFFQQFLSKAEAAQLVCDHILAQKPAVLPFVNYDPVIRDVLESRGVHCLPEGANCTFVASA